MHFLGHPSLCWRRPTSSASKQGSLPTTVAKRKQISPQARGPAQRFTLSANPSKATPHCRHSLRGSYNTRGSAPRGSGCRSCGLKVLSSVPPEGHGLSPCCTPAGTMGSVSKGCNRRCPSRASPPHPSDPAVARHDPGQDAVPQACADKQQEISERLPRDDAYMVTPW